MKLRWTDLAEKKVEWKERAKNPTWKQEEMICYIYRAEKIFERYELRMEF